VHRNFFYLFPTISVSTAVDRGFEPRSGQTKDYKLVFVASPLSTHYYGERVKTGWLGIRLMCPSGATSLSVDNCSSELVESDHHHLCECNLFSQVT
jgi:hypothetical protein